MRNLYGSVLILLALVLGTLSWTSGRAADRAGSVLDTLEGLRAAVPTLTQEVLRLRASMSHSQDAVVRALQQADALLGQAESQARLLDADADFDPPTALQPLRTFLQEKEALAERFRSGGALVQNSLDYLVDLDRNAGARPPDGVRDLVRSALLYDRSGDADTAGQMREALGRLAAARTGASAETAEDLGFADRHARRILDLSPRVSADLQQLVARTLEPRIDALHAQVSQRRQAAARTSQTYRDAMFVTGAVFVLSIAAFLQRDRRRAADLNLANLELESRVEERTRKLADHEAETRAILEGSADGILSVEEDGSIRSANPAVAAMFGLSAAAIAGRPLSSIVSISWDEIRSAGARKRDGTGARITGEKFPLEIQANEVRLGERRMYSVLLRDVTEMRRVEQLKNEFISTVSHELRTPLTSIRGALGLVASGVLGSLSPKAKPMIDIAAKNCERLVALVSDILDIEKVASGKMTFKMRTLQLSDLVTQTVDATRGFADSLGIRLSVSLPAGDTLVLADSDRLTQVLTNLVSNACKFSPKGEMVTVEVLRSGGRFHVGVSDRGPGIPDEFHPHIFQKFAQADASDGSQRKGTGLGLAISKALTERMGGTIGFDTKLGAGSTFWVELNEERPAAPVSTSSSRPRILVCEDERDISEVLRQMLDKEGYDCDLAPTLKEARVLLAAWTYAGMTLDLSLPDGSGIALLKEIRGNPATRELPVIVISANLEQNATALSGNAFGLVDWLEKPIPQERLEQALRRTSVHAASRKPRVLHVEDDDDIIAVVGSLLSDTAEIVHAKSVLGAWEILKREDFDLLILDIGLPDGSGLELLPALRSSTKTPIPSLVFSAHEISPRTAGTVTSALLKSKTSNEELVRRVKSLLGKSPSRPRAARV